MVHPGCRMTRHNFSSVSYVIEDPANKNEWVKFFVSESESDKEREYGA